MDNQNIKSTFSPRSDLVLTEIMRKNNLEGGSVGFLLEKITMFFSRAEISEQEMISSIQKEVGVSQKIAEQMATEIKNRIIPTLWNNLSEKDREFLMHEKKPAVEAPEEIVQEKTPTKSAPPASTPTINKKSSGPDRYREPIG